MEFEIYKYRQSIIRSLAKWIYLFMAAACYASMTRYIGTTESLFQRFHAPVWLYVVTSLITIILVILGFNSMITRSKFVIIIENGKAKIFNRKISREIKEIEITNNINIKADFSINSPDERIPWTLVKGKEKIVFLVESNRTGELRESLKKL